jgi:cyclic pyranopterin phosphate synthase
MLRLRRRRAAIDAERVVPDAVTPDLPSSLCLAPSSMLYLAPDGNVRVCCRSLAPLGNVADRPLSEIWHGAMRHRMADAITAQVLPQGCEQCGVEMEVEGRERSYPVRFDRFTPALAGDADPRGAWPLRIEFNLSNACNLMCIQCDGSLSSSIRAHREHLPALPRVYGDEFFEDLEQFIPRLTEAQFAGGEPFLGRENYRVWDLIERLNPDLGCTVVTNATQWSSRIERIGATLRMGYTFSIDALTKATYELIRVNSDHDVVMANVPRYMAMAAAQGTTVEINFCLMRQNHHEFGDLLVWAEQLGVVVNVCVVRQPGHCSLASLDRDELRRVVDGLADAEDRVLPHLALNRATWLEECERLRRWADSPEETRQQLWWSDVWSDPDARQHQGLVSILPTMSSLDIGVLDIGVLDVAVHGSAAQHELAEWATDGRTHVLRADYRADRDPDHVVVDVAPSLVEVLGLGSEQLLWRPVQSLQVELEHRFGPVAHVEVIRLPGASRSYSLQLRDADVRVAMLAEGDERGRLAGVTVIAAFRPGDAAAHVGEHPR